MPESKDELRARFSGRREALSVFAREQTALDLAEWVHSAPFGLGPGDTVAAYVPVGGEPGTTAMLDALVALGARVLLPVVPAGEPAALDWARYEGPDSLGVRRWGLLEPVGAPLGPDAVRMATAVLVPALAVDVTGVRLGRGAGYYDRSVAGLSAHLVAVVYDDEVVAALPGEPHDVRMTWALTPGGGWRRLSD